ncbi:MAG: ATP-binding protein [Gemmatimonadaceae bacterium]|nr:ATP-binding protein [Gemmatimonadaceae bacterium]
MRRALVETIGASSRCLVWGPRGIGKTETLQRLIREELRTLAHPHSAPRIVHVPLIGVQRERDALISMAHYVPLPSLAQRARQHRLSVDNVRSELVSALRQQGRTILIVDEAHQLAPSALKAVLDLMVEADYATNGGAEARWLGVMLIASSPHHRALLGAFEANERVQSIVELTADSRETIATILRQWLPELANHPAFSTNQAALEQWIDLQFGGGVPSLRAIADVVQRYQARQQHAGEGSAEAPLNLKLLNAQVKGLLGVQQRLLAPPTLNGSAAQPPARRPERPDRAERAP